MLRLLSVIALFMLPVSVFADEEAGGTEIPDAAKELPYAPATIKFITSGIPKDLEDPNLQSSDLVAGYLVGCSDIHDWCGMDVRVPDAVLDFDGGRFRIILQNELNPHDQVRVIDGFIGCEWVDDRFGARGRHEPGRYCWGRLDGGDYSFILDDNVAHNIVTPWDWFFMMDYQWRTGGTPLKNQKIRMVSHPHVTARVLFYK